MKSKYLLLTTIAFAITSSCTPKEEWIQLFNGKDLNDWTIKMAKHKLGENFNNTFRVEDGLLKVRYDKYDKFNGEYGHIFYKTPFSHYKLRVEYRFVGEQIPGGARWALRNGGVMLHGQTPQSMDINQEFPTCVEVQFLGGDGKNERSTLNVCTPGTNIVINDKLITEHCINSTSKTYHGDQWVMAEIEVYGDSLIRHTVDGKVVLEYTQPQLDENDPSYSKLLPANGDKLLKSGTISLQAESHPVDYRKVELLNLEKKYIRK